MKVWIVAVALGITLSAAGASCAMAQAGSTGGTLGNTDKSISGERREEPAAQPRAREPKSHTARKAEAGSSCGRIAGSWKWGSATIAIKADGTAQHAVGGSGTWTCNGGQYVFTWSNGITDRVTLSVDGNSLSWSNNLGWTGSGTRI
jgi:hypothetical protein